MKIIKFLAFVLILGSIASCSKPENFELIQGTWQLQSLEYNAQSTDILNGAEAIIDVSGVGEEIDLEWDIDGNTIDVLGAFEMNSIITSFGQVDEQTEWIETDRQFKFSMDDDSELIVIDSPANEVLTITEITSETLKITGTTSESEGSSSYETEVFYSFIR